MSACGCRIKRMGRAPANGPVWEKDLAIHQCSLHWEAKQLMEALREIAESLRCNEECVTGCDCSRILAREAITAATKED